MKLELIINKAKAEKKAVYYLSMVSLTMLNAGLII
jgi:hypothetical protein